MINKKVLFYSIVLIFVVFTFFVLNKRERYFFKDSKEKVDLESIYYWKINYRSDFFLNNRFKTSFNTLSFHFNGYSTFKDSTLYFCDSFNNECVGFFNFKKESIGINYTLLDNSECVRSFKDKSDGNYYFLKKQVDPFDNKACYIYVFSLKKGLVSEAKINPFSKQLIEIIGNKNLIHYKLSEIKKEMDYLIIQ